MIIPKVELHLHLEGAAPPEFIRRLAGEKHQNIEGVFDERGGYAFRDFAHFLKVYEAATSILRAPAGGASPGSVIALTPVDALLDPLQVEPQMQELCTFIDLHLELVVRELYPEAFFGGKVSDDVKASVRKRLDRHIPAFKKLAAFSPYVAGADFTLADCAAWVSLPLVTMATRGIYGEDLLATHGLELKPYLKLIGERPSAQRVVADRKREQDALKAASAASASPAPR